MASAYHGDDFRGNHAAPGLTLGAAGRTPPGPFPRPQPGACCAAMQREPLTSTALVSAGYDPHTRELELEFRGGRVYRYRDVPHGVYEFLLRTPNKGGYVNRMIDGHYPHEDVSPAPPAQDLLEALTASLVSEPTEGRD
jgi:hypothetical protein